MRRFVSTLETFSTLGQTCAQALLVRGDRAPLAPLVPVVPLPAEDAPSAQSPTDRPDLTGAVTRRPAPARHAARSLTQARAILAAAIVLSLLLPFASNGVTVAAAAAPVSPAATVRAAESPDGLTHIALIPGESEARYIMTITTLGQPPKQAACTTRSVTGDIVLNPDGSIVTELSKIVLDQRTLKCAPPLRDQQAQNLLQTAQHP